MNREKGIEQLRAQAGPWDFIIIGGGATGLGTAVDAATRGYRTLLVEASDFAKGTSSRSTKLIHGGVRYLKQGNIGLVLEALRERGLLCRNAAHLAGTLGFVIPVYDWHGKAFYGAGLKLYDRLAGRLSLGRSRILSRRETGERLPTARRKGLRGGVFYCDAQFDDARLAVNLAQTAEDHGAVVLNYVRAAGLIRERGRVGGVRLHDEETGEEFEVRGRCVINATGVYCDEVRRMESPGTEPILVVSRGTHLVLPREFQPGEDALMVPKTADGRVLFAVPWHGRVVLGTTDTPAEKPCLEPRASDEEIEFLLTHAAGYLERAPGADDVLSVFSGLRPLVSSGRAGAGTAALSRDHTILISDGGLVTITGGKWTTCRRMASDVLDRAERSAGFEHRPCVTRTLPIHGWTENPTPSAPLGVYGADGPEIAALAREDPGLDRPLHKKLDCLRAEVVWAARNEMARTVEDVLARRTRSLVLDARASMEAAPEAARLLARELGRDFSWEKAQAEKFRALAKGYLVPPGRVPAG